MSFWGMSDAGKEAGGFNREKGAWDFQQYKDWLAQSNRSGDLANLYTGNAADYWGQQQQNGWASPAATRLRGQEISPWADGAIATRRGRLNEIEAMQRGLRSADDIAGEMSGRLDEQGRSITGNFNDIQGTIDSTTGRLFGREEGASRDIINNIRDTGASMTGAVNDTFGGLRRDNAATSGRLRADSDAAFTNIYSDLESLKPGSEAATARTARSFAPQTSDTLMRLRRSGVDPNSVQAQSIMRGVESARSRAMDDTMADGNLKYTDRLTSTRKDQLGFNTDNENSRLRNEMSLGTGQVDRTNSIADGVGKDFRGAVRTSADNMNTIDGNRAAATINNLDTTTLRSMGLSDRRNALTGMQRDMNRKDNADLSNVLDRQNQEDLVAGGLYDEQFNQGNNWNILDRSVRDGATGQLSQIGRDYRQSQFQGANTANAFGNSASQNYGTAYDREAASAGWGGRMLGGIAAAGLNMVAPGAGSLVTGAMGGMPGGGGATQSGQPNGGWGGQPQQSQQSGGSSGGPSAWSNFTNLFRRSPATVSNGSQTAGMGGYYNPSSTTTLPNGSLQVGR